MRRVAVEVAFAAAVAVLRQDRVKVVRTDGRGRTDGLWAISHTRRVGKWADQCGGGVGGGGGMGRLPAGACVLARSRKGEDGRANDPGLSLNALDYRVACHTRDIQPRFRQQKGGDRLRLRPFGPTRSVSAFESNVPARVTAPATELSCLLGGEEREGRRQTSLVSPVRTS